MSSSNICTIKDDPTAGCPKDLPKDPKNTCEKTKNEYDALIEQAKRDQIYKEEEKAARAQCKGCRKPFPGIFRKKRYQANSLGDLTRDYYCKDCFLALPKNEKLDEPRDVSDPWAW